MLTIFFEEQKGHVLSEHFKLIFQSYFSELKFFINNILRIDFRKRNIACEF